MILQTKIQINIYQNGFNSRIFRQKWSINLVTIRFKDRTEL